MLENLIGLLTAAGLAGLVGLEREMHLQKANTNSFGGFRTFAMMGMLGFLSMMIEKQLSFKGITIVVFCAAFILIAISHTANVLQSVRIGLTSKLSALASFLIGILVACDEIVFAISVSILFALLLALKDFLHKIAKNFESEEFLAVLKFLIIAGIILPLLPNRTVDTWGIFNPQEIWLMIVLVASIRFVGFFLSKIFGHKKGLVLTGTLGGLISSTAVTVSLSEQNKKSEKLISPFLVGILFASSLMFVRAFIETQIVSPELAKVIALPLFIMALVALIIGLFAYLKKPAKVEQKEEILHAQPFSLSEALKFGLFFMVILTAVKVVPMFLGNMGLFLTAAISGLADIDAITLSVSNLAKTNEISFELAAQTITLAVMSNTVVKMVIVGVFGGKKLALIILGSLSVVIASGIAALLYV